MISHYVKTGNTTFDSLGHQEWGLMQMARSIGISEARTLILKAELIFGEEKLRAALKDLQLSGNTLQKAIASQSATAPESKPDG